MEKLYLLWCSVSELNRNLKRFLQNRKKQLDKQICAGIVTFEPTNTGLTFIFLQTANRIGRKCGLKFEITFDWNMMREASAPQCGAVIQCKTSAAMAM